MFIVGTVLDALHAQCAQEVRATTPANSDCTAIVNDVLMGKLENSSAFKNLQQLGIFRRNFITAVNKKDVFRA